MGEDRGRGISSITLESPACRGSGIFIERSRARVYANASASLMAIDRDFGEYGNAAENVLLLLQVGHEVAEAHRCPGWPSSAWKQRRHGEIRHRFSEAGMASPVEPSR